MFAEKLKPQQLPEVRLLERPDRPGDAKAFMKYKVASSEEIPILPGFSAPATFSEHDVCKMQQGSSCPLSGLSKGKVTSIYPGGRTRCMYGTDFNFQVIPGDTDKLLLHLDGGGACWDQLHLAGACMTEPLVKDMIGMRNLCPGFNPFGNHTAILVPQCSGDLFAGDVARPWKNRMNKGVPVEQRGYLNTRSVLAWVKANMDPKFSHFAFTGESAGAIGAMVWAPALLKEFQYDRAYVLADSFVGVFPDHFQGFMWKDYGACETILAGEKVLQEMCEDTNINISTVFEFAMQEFPDVTFGHLNSKHDLIQVLFYGAASTTLRIREVEELCGDRDPDECILPDSQNKSWSEVADVPEIISPRHFHRRMEDAIEQFSKYPNYISYMMSSHCHSCGHSTFGSCPIDYEHPPSSLNTGWLMSNDEEQRQSVQNWVMRFFDFTSAGNKSSHCEKFLLHDKASPDPDDWCADAQQIKRLV